MDVAKELSCNGIAPTGPVSAWPKERHERLILESSEAIRRKKATEARQSHATKVNASLSTMAKGIVNSVGQAVRNGKVSEEIRNERYDTCKSCPLFIEESKRCSECGCFMEAKTWVGGDPDALCPKKKWER